MTDVVPDLADASTLPDQPVTRRGRRTRASLVAAARVVFERDGYLSSRLTDITAEAHCSIGTFYTYFTSKEEVFTAVLAEAQHDMLDPGTSHLDPDDSDPAAVIEASNRAYFESYERNARLMVLQEQVAHIDERFRRIRWARGEAFAQRNARSIAELQARGLAVQDVDPLEAARALSGMVSRMAYTGLTHERTTSIDDLVYTASRLWTRALGLEPPADH